jgi:hypothetical protein
MIRTVVKPQVQTPVPSTKKIKDRVDNHKMYGAAAKAYCFTVNFFI